MAKIKLTRQQQKKVAMHRKRRGFMALKYNLGMGRIPRPMKRKSLALTTHNFVERCATQEIVVGPEATAVGLFRYFQLSQINQVSSYTAIFEQFRINKVVVEFRYKATGTPAYAPINGAGTSNVEIVNEVNPVLYFKVDHNDADSDSLATLKESMKTREHQFTNNRPNFTITLKPAVQVEAYKTALSSAYMPKWGQWLNVDDSAVPHYGLKAYCVAGRSGSSANIGTIEVQSKIYFSCKNNE